MGQLTLERVLLPVLQHIDFEDLFSEDELEPVEGDEVLVEQRPSCRAECKDVPRPCPFVSCRFNLYLDIRGDGVLRLNFPDRDPDEMLTSCALDLAEDGPRTLEQVADLMGMSKERARQIEGIAMAKMREHLLHGWMGED